MIGALERRWLRPTANWPMADYPAPCSRNALICASLVCAAVACRSDAVGFFAPGAVVLPGLAGFRALPGGLPPGGRWPALCRAPTRSAGGWLQHVRVPDRSPHQFRLWCRRIARVPANQFSFDPRGRELGSPRPHANRLQSGYRKRPGGFPGIAAARSNTCICSAAADSCGAEN